MNNIAFVLWLILFPLSWEISKYYCNLNQKLNNKEEYIPSKDTFTCGILLYLIVVIVLFNK